MEGGHLNMTLVMICLNLVDASDGIHPLAPKLTLVL